MVRNTAWTEKEDAILAQAVKDNVSPLRLAARLGRSLNSIKRRIRELGLNGARAPGSAASAAFQVSRWMGAAKSGDLAGLMDMYRADATLECACTGPAVYAGSEAIRQYWAPKLRDAAPLAFSLLQTKEENGRISVDYLSFEAKPVRMFITLDEAGKIVRSICGPHLCTKSAA
ncbi:nuclear transport factor 2 family protein [Pseudorhodoplanes sp.]|uniref:nuclear transport factor 2 family protein n=1 Tax=Pseudorhodoplanes sp. TaxID=1934341 RepID=UPI002CC48314|nr:nuclear transport factor 2 family protein [Pseudorhodoplanes sp.]HWV43029.1 nuclear transport factor 2 family protein [Pseudorhodoplanes sp.]